MDYRYHSVEDFATDVMFRQWVMEPTPEISTFWLKWIAEHPEKFSEIAMARELVLTVFDIHQDNLPDAKIQAEVEKITRLAESQKEKPVAGIYSLFQLSIWRVAAVFLLVSGIGFWIYKNENNAVPRAPLSAKDAPTEVVLVRKNETKREMTVLLSDNSVATLSPGSEITYPKTFAQGERKVILIGEAFFDVAKNPDQPFLVYANETVTKVLGTSFRIKAIDQENTVMVLVKTGRVSVYPKTAYETWKSKPEKPVSVIVLDPNQQAVFDRKNNRLEKGIVSNRQLLSELSAQKELIFDEKPVSQVFRTLHEIYGVVIDYDQQMLANCIITTQFSDENLKQRLNAICQAIGASYEMVDGKIVITSKGCS